MTKLILGIDPGQKGGIVALGQRTGRIVQKFPMPKEPPRLASFLSSHTIVMAWIEKAQAYPRQGIRSTFNYGTHFGMLQGMLIALRIPFALVSPRTWQKEMFFKTTHKCPKAKALAAANRIFAKKKDFWIHGARAKKPHDGIVDAALIAGYGQKKFSDISS